MWARRTGAQRRTHPRRVGIEVLEDRCLLSAIGSPPVEHPGHGATTPEVRGSAHAHAHAQGGADKHSLGRADHGKDSPGQSRGAGGSRPGDTSRPVAHALAASAEANGASNPTSRGRLRAEADTVEVNVAAEVKVATVAASSLSGAPSIRAEADTAEVNVVAPEDATPDAAAAGTSLGAASLNPSAVFLVFLLRTGAPSVGVNAIPAEGQFAPPVGGLAAPAAYQAGRWGPLGAVASADLQATVDQALMDFSPGGLDAPADLLPDLLQPRADAPESLREQLFDWAGGDPGRAWLPWVVGVTLSALALELARRQLKWAKVDDPFLSPDFALVGWPPQAGGTERGWS